jgi:hypothetical protein
LTTADEFIEILDALIVAIHEHNERVVVGMENLDEVIELP